MRRHVALLAACALVAGCAGGGPDAEEVLSETAAKLGELRSGTLHLDLRVEPRGGTGGEEFGFALDGPFSLGGSGPLPVADVEYTQTVGDESATVGIVSTGRNAYIRVVGRTYEMPPEQAQQLRAAAGGLEASRGLGRFAIDQWIEDPEVDDGGEVGGAETDRVQADLDVVAAVRDLLALARQLGQDVPRLADRDAERLAESVRSSRFEVYTGKDDRLLRRLEIEVDFGLDVPRELREALGSLVGARILFELGVDDPNRPVRVAEPEDALPASELPQG
ncbi:MAG: hypothetical protein M3321_05080 [Actinomycetota bacterium]|nr:hypothetical protein [Actinomycetota bacterium]